MIIQHNIAALNSHRNLGINNTNLNGNLEKLSSGYRINRAADDAAGLAISEKMRAQITGLDRAILNAQDGASLIQTAEGALSQVHEMLNRMVELGTQSANGTLGADDRAKIESEVTALKDEIDRISKATNFNGLQLLDGSLADDAVSNIVVSGVKVGEQAAVQGVSGFDVTDLTAAALYEGSEITFTVALDNGESTSVTFKVSNDGKNLVSESGTVYTLDVSASKAGGTAANMTALNMADMLETELRKTGLQNDFIIDAAGATGATDATGIVLTNRTAGTDAPQVKGISWATKIDGKNSLETNLATIAADTDKVTASNANITTKVASDEVRTIAQSNMVIFEVENTNVTNEDRAIFSVNGEKFILVNAEAMTASDEYKEALSELKNRGVNIIMTTTDDETALTAVDMQNIASTINQKCDLAFQVDTTGGVGSLKLVLGTTGENAGLTMQIGDTGDEWNKITVAVNDMSTRGLNIANIDMGTQESANRAIDSVKAAIEKVSVARGDLGALQNRLDYTIANLGVTKENMTAAESRIRDVDMAEEMMDYTKNNVLAQAAQAMLAQANQQPQNVLQLLR